MLGYLYLFPRTKLIASNLIYLRKFMDNFILQYTILCVILCAIGLFFIIMSFCAERAGRSGVPFIGGIFIAAGFLITPVKWLAFLGLIDYSYWSFLHILISNHIHSKRFKAVYSEQNYTESAMDNTKLLHIKIYGKDQELIKLYVTSKVYELRVPKLLFSVCTDKTGNLFLLVDRCVKGSNIDILDFHNEYILITELESKKEDLAVEIKVVRR